jgi:hypothetical protein
MTEERDSQEPQDPDEGVERSTVEDLDATEEEADRVKGGIPALALPCDAEDPDNPDLTQ